MKNVSNVNMRDVARLAGVSVMTVSLALRNSPKIAESTRKRIEKIAKKVGYRINPLVSAQMASIRAKRLIRYEATIGLLVCTPNQGVGIGTQKTIDGVIKACSDSGFGCDIFELADREVSAKCLNRILKSRGICALIQAPMRKDLGDYDIDFSKLVLVSCNTGSLPQTFHRVCPDYYGDMDMLLHKLYRHGFRKLGLMLPREMDRLTNHLWASRFLAFQQTEDLEKIPLLMPEDGPSFSEGLFLDWYNAYQPDVLIVSNQELFEKEFFEKAGLNVPSDIEIVKININDTEKGFSGINMMSEEVGESSLKLLSQLMYQNEFGKPDKPISILVPGVWVSGNMCPSLAVE